MPEPTLLCVDDEPAVLSSLRRLLRKEDYRILLAGSGDEALALLGREPVQVVLSDYRMPGMSGTELLRQVRLRHPDTVRVVLSGYADVHVVLDAIHDGEVYRFLAKPWDDEALKVELRQCFERYRLLRQHGLLLEQVEGREAAGKDGYAAGADRHDLYREVLDRLPVAVLGLDLHGTVLLANVAARTLLSGMEPGGTLAQGLPPEVARCVAEGAAQERRFERCLLQGRPFRLFVAPFSPDGAAARGTLVVLQPADDGLAGLEPAFYPWSRSARPASRRDA